MRGLRRRRQHLELGGLGGGGGGGEAVEAERRQARERADPLVALLLGGEGTTKEEVGDAQGTE